MIGIKEARLDWSRTLVQTRMEANNIVSVEAESSLCSALLALHVCVCGGRSHLERGVPRTLWGGSTSGSNKVNASVCQQCIGPITCKWWFLSTGPPPNASPNSINPRIRTSNNQPLLFFKATEYSQTSATQYRQCKQTQGPAAAHKNSYA